MKKTILLFAAVLLANVSFSQSLYSELSNWDNFTEYCPKFVEPTCPTFSSLCVNDWVTPGSCSPDAQWQRMGTPHMAMDGQGNVIGVGIWSRYGEGEGIFTSYPFIAGKSYQIRVGVRSFNKTGSSTTKLRMFAASNVYESTTFPCCAEAFLEKLGSPGVVDDHWKDNIAPPALNSTLPQIEHIMDFEPTAAFSGTQDVTFTFTPTMNNRQFVIYAHEEGGTQLEIDLDYIEIIGDCSTTDWFYAGITTDPTHIGFNLINPLNNAFYNWDFGDGNTVSSGAGTPHDYASLGSYHVCLNQDYEWGATCEFCRDICLNQPVVQDVDGVVDPMPCDPPHFQYVVYPDVTNFFINVMGNPGDLVEIDFGDGTPTLLNQSRQNNISHNYLVAGSYTVCAKSMGVEQCEVCLDICIDQIFDGGANDGGGNSKPAKTTSLQDNNMSRGFGIIDIVPNPASDHVSVNVAVGQSDANTVAVTFYDMTGKKVLEYEHAVVPGSNALDIDISELNSGMYILNVQNGTNTVKSKVIKQ